MNSTRNCPLCKSQNIEEVKDYSRGLGVFAIRFHHDRKCNECEASWTPPTPLWGAWACLLSGVAFLVTFGSLCCWGISEHWDLILENPREAKQLIDSLGGIGPFAAMLLIPGTGCLIFGLRALFSNREIAVQSQPLKSTTKNPLPEYEELLFTKEVSNEHRGRPVGLHSLGVLAYDLRGRCTEIEIIPYTEIEQLKVDRETRGQRIWSTFWITLGLLAFGLIGSLIFYNMFIGTAPKLSSDVPALGIVVIFGWAFLGPIALLAAPLRVIRCFTRLGVHLSIVTNEKKRGRYYFEPRAWDQQQSDIFEFLRRYQPDTILPQ